MNNIINKLSFILIACCIGSNAYAKQCTTSWDLKAVGFFLGTSKEVLIIKEDGSLSLTSNFTPNGALKSLGVDQVKRFIVMDSNQVVLSRSEVVGEDKKNYLWTKIKNNTYRFDKNGQSETVAVEPGKRIIDSTIFPYMYYLNMFDSSSMDVKVFGSDPAYEASVKMQKQDKVKLTFSGGKNKGYVILNEDKYPSYFNFTQGGKTVEGIQTSWSCN